MISSKSPFLSINLRLVPFLLLVLSYSFSQVGIGTDTVGTGVLLEINDPSSTTGVLLPQANIIDLSTAAPLPAGIETGTLVYNTNIASGIGYYFWNGFVWDRFNAAVGEMVKYVNPAVAVTGQNLSAVRTVQLIGAVEFNDNPVLYQTDGNTGVRIMDTGVYQVTVSLSLRGTYGPDRNRGRAEIDARIFVNGGARGPLYRSTEMNITNAAGDFDNGSITFTQSVIINAGEIITVRTARSAGNNTGEVRLRSTGTSTMFIQKTI